MFNIHVIYVKLDTEIKGWLFDFSVKVFELEVNSVNQSLMTNKQQKRQSADETAEEACSMNTSPTMPQNAKRKPGRPKSTNSTKVMAKIFVQDPFNPICFSENSEKYSEVDSIICIVTNALLRIALLTYMRISLGGVAR